MCVFVVKCIIYFLFIYNFIVDIYSNLQIYFYIYFALRINLFRDCYFFILFYSILFWPVFFLYKVFCFLSKQ